MTWAVVWTDAARHDLRRMDSQVRERVFRAVVRFAETGQGNVKKLTGSPAEWRLRVGDWRVRFVYDYETAVINVIRVLPRDRAYRR